MEEDYNGLFLGRLFRCGVYVGHFGVVDFDAVQGEGKVRGDFFVGHDAGYSVVWKVKWSFGRWPGVNNRKMINGDRTC